MTHTPDSQPLPRIQTPCPKRWDELVGNEKKRFCSECSLHVHNGAALTRNEADTLIKGATGRVCMRLELDPAGAPVFLDTKPATPRRELRRRTFAARAAGWAASAAAAVLAACARTAPLSGVETGPPDSCTLTSTKMGKVAGPEKLGDVAAPQVLGGVEAPPVPAPTIMRLGEVSLAPDPQAPPATPPTPPTSTPESAGPR